MLVCRSRQERDRLRSVYPSAVAAEDLSMVDMSSCVNIVHETNTVMAQTSGQHWRFTTYPTAVKELKSQLLEQNITKEDEQDLYLGTNDIFRPDLKQIGNSLFEIRRYFVEKDGQNFAPTKLRTPLAQVKERLIEHIENHAYDFVFDPLTNEVVDFPNPKAGPCFVFLSHSLSVALDFCTSHRPSNAVCDVFLALPTQSVIVLSLVDGDEDCPEAVTYSMSVARGVIETLSKFTDEDINSIHGVIPISLLEDAVGFKNRLKKLANESSHFVTNDSLVMTPSRYEKVLTAFWAGVAETKSVLKEESGDTDGDYLRFLTKEQCIILVENINSKDVEVKCMPGSGATTLMLEVARRLNRLGDTMLVCRSRQERDRLRSVYPSAVAAEDLSMVDMSSCVNIVHETNTVMAQTSGQHWRFTTYPTAVKELKSQLLEVEMEVEGMEKQIDALSNESWKERIEHILRDFSVLKIFSFKLGSTGPMSYAHEVRHTLEYKPSPLTASKGQYASLGGFKQLSATQEAWLPDLHDGLRERKNLVPLLRSVIIQDKTDQICQDVKNVLLREALGIMKHTESKQTVAMVGHVQSPDIQQQMEMFYIESENAGMESNIPQVWKEGGQINDMETEVQNTDGKDPESRWDEIQTLNQELDNVLKDRDRRKGQLHKLYTVEWQAVMKYLANHKADLSMLDIEIPGFQVFQGLPGRHETTFPGRVISVQGTSAVSTVGHEEIGEQFGPSKRNRRRLDVSGSATSQSDNTNNGRDKAEQRHTRAPGLMNQLKQYQQGRLTEKHLCAITMKIIRDNEQQLMELKANNGCLEKDYGSSVHVVGRTRRPLLVSLCEQKKTKPNRQNAPLQRRCGHHAHFPHAIKQARVVTIFSGYKTDPIFGQLESLSKMLPVTLVST
ncbi:uncharacterized protein LOC124265552 isoform X3 [Haliotis rubra]|uniref:uncharacterized protein LOC124265552 isoform X3 n=1 Tax=Haliotis rubra TaxID=36100 RepID=UPI001EE5CE53|nr:uncharacterized protein LOC124265552 isoform X3 [Haliotis rubra]